MIANLASVFLYKFGADKLQAFLNPKAAESKHRRFKLSERDVQLFDVIEERIRQRMSNPTRTSASGYDPIFQEQVIGFSTVMSAARKYLLLNDGKRSKHFEIYLTFERNVSVSPCFLLEIRRNSEGTNENALMTMSQIDQL